MWVATAFGSTVAIAAWVLTHRGVGRVGVESALRMTARLAFAFFWPAYVGGALAALFGPRLGWLKARGRALGLAFATVLAVHLCLVGYLCWIGSPPPVSTFVIFGLGVAWTALLGLVSIERLGRAVGAVARWTLRNFGMNYLAFLFILDFVKLREPNSVAHAIEYVPFATLAIPGPVLRLLA